MAADERKRIWTFEVYPDSAPPDWIRILDYDYMLEFCVSPLHDKDLYDGSKKLPAGKAVGDPKKPHYHCIVKFEGPVSFNQVKEFTDAINQPRPEYVRNLRKMTRYLIHLDNPEKAQYCKEDIRTFGGFDLGDALHPKGSEVEMILNEIEEFIYRHDIVEFADLAEAIKDTCNDDWRFVFRSCRTNYFKALMSSRHFRKKEALKVIVASPSIPSEDA